MPNREIAHDLVDYLQSDRTRLTHDEAEYLTDQIADALDAAERRGLERAAEWHDDRASWELADPHTEAAAAIRALEVKP